MSLTKSELLIIKVALVVHVDIDRLDYVSVIKAQELIERELKLKEIEKSFDQAHGLNNKTND